MRIRSLTALLALAAGAASQQALSTTFGPPGGYTGAKVAAGRDMDGDGVPDLLVTSSGTSSSSIYVVSGATNSVRQLTNPGNSTFPNNMLLGVPDLNLDGRGDIVADVNGALRAYSGATLAPLWTTAVAYWRATAIGDRNGDGRGDLAAISTTNPAELRVLNGSDGSVLSVFPLANGFGEAFLAIGDIDGDGVTELARGFSNSIEVLRLANPPLLLTIPFPGYTLGAGNFAGDARNEIVAGETNSNATVRVLSATTGSLLRAWSDVPQGTFAVIGDLDADGFPELALRKDPFVAGSPGGNLDIVSGATGTKLATWPATAQFRCGAVAAAGDLNADGFGDLLVGDTSASSNGAAPRPGGWQRLSGKILATMTSQPQSCAQGPFFPVLGITRPMLGQPCTIAGQNAPANTVGFVAFSTQPAVPTSLGVVGCDAWFDLTSGSLLYQPTTTNWQFTFPVPAIPQLAGAAVALQAFYAPTQSAIGIDVTNGIWARLGY